MTLCACVWPSCLCLCASLQAALEERGRALEQVVERDRMLQQMQER